MAEEGELGQIPPQNVEEGRYDEQREALVADLTADVRRGVYCDLVGRPDDTQTP